MTAMYTLKKGGAYERFQGMVEALLDRKCDVHCISLTPIRIEDPFYHNHVLSLPFKIKGNLAVKLMVLLLFPIYALLIGWREKIDLFVAFGPLYAFLQAIPKSMMMKPMVTLIRSELSLASPARDLSKFFLWIKRVVEYFGLIFSDRVVTVNTAMENDVMRFMKRRNKIDVKVLFNNIPQIPMPVDSDVIQTRRQWAIPEGAKVLITAGILTPRKNIEILIKCLPKIEIKDIFLFVIGDDSTQSNSHYRDSLHRLPTELGVDKRVIFTGWLEKAEMWNIFRIADLFVLPSKTEGMPNVVLEALGVDLPCMGSNIQGIEDILQYGELMFNPLNEEAMVNKLNQFFLDPEYSNHITELCRKRKKAFMFDWGEKIFQMVTMGFRDGSNRP